MTCYNCKKKCKHKLEYCSDCGNVYCTLCKEVWEKKLYTTSVYLDGTTYYGTSGDITKNSIPCQCHNK